MKRDEAAGISGRTASYDIFHGVTLTYMGARAEGPAAMAEDVLVIDYCHEGCVECPLAEQRVTLGTGDVLVHGGGHRLFEAGFPPAHFRGIRLAVDLRCAAEGLGPMLRDLNIDLTAFGEKFCACGQPTLFRAHAALIQTFSALYHAPEALRPRYAKAKMPELILLLDTCPRSAGERRRFSRYAVEQTRAVRRHLALNTGRQITIAELSKRFGISQTVLKECFRRTYGESIAACARRLRMERAAALLRTTDLNILEIAMQVGYGNASKFSRGFRAVFGCNPHEYRRRMG